MTESSFPIPGQTPLAERQNPRPQVGNMPAREDAYIMPMIWGRSQFITDGIHCMDILFLYMTERGRVRESTSSVVFRMVPP